MPLLPFPTSAEKAPHRLRRDHGTSFPSLSRGFRPSFPPGYEIRPDAISRGRFPLRASRSGVVVFSHPTDDTAGRGLRRCKETRQVLFIMWALIVFLHGGLCYWGFGYWISCVVPQEVIEVSLLEDLLLWSYGTCAVLLGWLGLLIGFLWNRFGR
ncbi:hypothetical protein ZIOFF_035688 [Zingiber officinale]|uniref:Uncharacterized protein n=1 Tax=Zingiber officinale TaxID=94328 RepID=A0A8J5GA00_ZINOF|nr:hypothetical protein ZIOFF_035688 [Zingiber officinale]